MVAQSDNIDSGTRRLWQLGYRQTLPRSLTWVQNCSICFCIVSPVTAITGLYSQGLLYGGPVVLLWSWLVTGGFTVLVGLSMAELSSCFPVSGGLYFWAFAVGQRHGPLASYVVGWLNLLGQVAFVAGNTFTVVSLLAAAIFLASNDLCDEAYYPGNSMQLYIFGGLLILNATLNSMPLTSISKLARVSAVWMITGTFLISTVLLIVTEKRQKWQWVLTHYEPNTASGISSTLYVCLLGMLTATWSFTGYDSAAHLIEETKAADTNAGYPMLYAIVLSFAVGLVYLLTLTICIQDITAYTDPPAQLAGITYTAQIIWTAFSSQNTSGLTSLMLFGFSRDQAVPLWEVWQQVDASTHVPNNAVWGIAAGAFLLGLPLLGGVEAFLATTSIATAGLAIAYGIPILLRLTCKHDLQPGPYNLGRWSRPVGWVAVVWLAFITVIFCLPAVYPITSVTLNYAPVAVGSVIFLVLVSWTVSARHWFSGPRAEVDSSDIVKMNHWLTDPPRNPCHN